MLQEGPRALWPGATCSPGGGLFENQGVLVLDTWDAYAPLGGIGDWSLTSEVCSLCSGREGCHTPRRDPLSGQAWSTVGSEQLPWLRSGDAPCTHTWTQRTFGQGLNLIYVFTPRFLLYCYFNFSVQNFH